MLMLKRLPGQQICITVLAQISQRVKIGVQAPPHIPILCGELPEKAQPVPLQEPEHRPSPAEG